MTFSFTFNVLFMIALVGGALALIDGVIRAGRRSLVIGVLELIAAVLFLLSLFFEGIPLGALILAIVTIVLLVLGLLLPGRGSVAIGIIALILLVIWVVLHQHWLVIQGVNG